MKTLVLIFCFCISAIASANANSIETLQEPDGIPRNNIVFAQNDNTSTFYGKRNDTIYKVTVYYSSEKKENIDSVVVSDIYVHYKKENGKLWVCHYDNGETRICQFKKAKYLSKAYTRANDPSQWEAEYRMHGYKLYDPNMKLIAIEKRHGRRTVYKYVYH
ncbi:MAG: hypothetical protein J5642_07070 [Bacteroidales bacterium]|nr:hypothetical protein [Bacteroidales bacterium]